MPTFVRGESYELRLRGGIFVVAMMVGVPMLTLATQPAAGQGVIPSVIGNTIGNMEAQRHQERMCMVGTPMPRGEIQEALTSAQNTMNLYFATAGNSDVADVRDAYHRRGRDGVWVGPDGESALDRITDPVARRVAQANVDVPEPSAFVRAGDGRMAQGIWEITVPSISSGDAHEVIGQYSVDFQRRRGSWQIVRLQLYPAPDQAPAISQFCHEPGDVISDGGKPDSNSNTP